jgi:hypothetical protein
VTQAVKTMRVHTGSSPDVSEIGVGSTGLQHRAGRAGENEASGDGVGVGGSTPLIRPRAGATRVAWASAGATPPRPGAARRVSAVELSSVKRRDVEHRPLERHSRCQKVQFESAPAARLCQPFVSGQDPLD